jgi:hypothetical protein
MTSSSSRHSGDAGVDPADDRGAAGPAADPPPRPARETDRTDARPLIAPAPDATHAARGAAGMVIGSRYALRSAIGNGGMGTVWWATDTLLRRDVAVKEVLLPQGMAPTDRDSMYQRTLREARAAAALSHPAVVQVYDVVTEGGRPWIVMELLQARSLAQIIVEDGPLAPRAVAKIGIALLGALEVAHAAGVLHRDVKPANVLICVDGRCVLTDFGVARMPSDNQLTTPGMVLGSPHFISPERAIGAPFGPPSDLFSLGVTLYTAVEGRPPFDRPDPIETMRAVVEEPPTPPIRAGALTNVLSGLLEKDPGRRWDVPTSRRELRELLAHTLASSAPAHQTDPYAVVRPAPYPAPSLAVPASGQIGGPAMLAPGETLSGAIRRRHDGGQRTPTQRPASDADTPTGARPPAGHAGTAETDLLTPPVRYRTGDPAGIGAGSVYGAPSAGNGGRHAAAPGDRAIPAQRGATALASVTASSAVAGARHLFARVLAILRELPPRGRVVLAASAFVAVTLLAVLTVALFSAGSEPRTPPGGRTTDPNKPLFAAVQAYRDKGITVNVPRGWTQSASGTFVDYTDPADPGRRARIDVENANTANARQVAAAASNGLADPRRCRAPYRQVRIRDLKVDGHSAAELEYTCGSGAQMRHGIWRFVVADGKSYNFFVTVPDSRFPESRVIYDEMVRSFQLTV